MGQALNPVPEGFHTVTPQLVFDEAGKAIDWYKTALGANEKMRSLGPDGKVMHAEVQIGSSILMMNDTMGGTKSPRSLGGSPIGLWVYVPDCDAVFNRAVAAGAQVPPGPMGQVADQFWGDRVGVIVDPFGYQWVIATRKEDLSQEEINRRAEEFFKQFGQQQASHA